MILYLKQMVTEDLSFDGHFLGHQNAYVWIWRLGQKSELEIEYLEVFIECNQWVSEWNKEEAQELTPESLLILGRS